MRGQTPPDGRGDERGQTPPDGRGDERGQTPPSPLELLGDKRAAVDTGLGPVAFVIANAIFGLHTAAWVAIGVAALVLLERLVRRRQATNALGGVLGTGLAVFIALRSGHAEGYFVPRMLYAAGLAILLAVSALIRRPLLGYLIVGLYRLPAAWLRQRGARRTSQELTFAWSGLFAFRAAVYAVLIAAGSVGALAAASIVMGWPAFALLLFLSYRYLPRRLTQLGVPPPRAS